MTFYVSKVSTFPPMERDLQIVARHEITAGKRALTTHILTDVKQIQAVLKTIQAWKGIIQDRVGESRAEHQRSRTEETGEALGNDLARKAEYIDLLGYFDLSLSKYVRDKAIDPQSRVLVSISVEEGDVNIQALALCKAYAEKKIVELKYLASAPWNLSMHGANKEENQSLVTRGCGTLLVCDIYRLAQREGLSSLRLKPLPGSESFYLGQIQMLVDEKERELYLDVHPEDPLPRLSELESKYSIVT